MAKERVVLVDGTALVFRAFFALPSKFQSEQGVPTNATYGFALMFNKIFAGRTPAYGAVVFDAPGRTFRDEMYPEYKAQRPKMPSELPQQLPWIDKVVQANRFPIVRISGVEADDVIGTLTRQALEAGHEVRIVSGDKDFAQLIGPDVRMVDTMRDITYDAEVARKKWGVPAAQMVDYLALLGDKVDNIPGVPGIGAKGAATLLARFGDLETLLDSTDQLKGRQQSNLREFRDQALLSRDLATIRCDVPLEFELEDIRVPPPDTAEVDALYRELGFYSLLDDGPEATEGDYEAVRDIAGLQAVLGSLGDGPIGVHALYDLPSFITGPLVGLTLARADGWTRYVPLFGPSGSLGGDAMGLLATWLEDPAQPKVAHDVRNLWTLLRRYDIELKGVVADTAIASFLVDPTGQIDPPHTLGKVSRRYLKRPLLEIKKLVGSGKSERPVSSCSIDDAAAYACQLGAAVGELWPALEPLLEREGQTAVMTDHCLPMAGVLAQMQRTGIRVDAEDLAVMQAEFSARKDDIEARIYEHAGHAFNIGSIKQLGAVLFEELELPVKKKTKTGYSTAQAALEPIRGEHEIIGLVLRWRALAKLINTYTEVLRQSLNPETGRVHCTFQQTAGATGRLITTDPDLQRTPIKTDDGKRIRQAFLPQEGWTLISADWSQIELRMLAHVCGEPQLIEAFANDVDVHRQTAAALFDCAPEAVTTEQRNVGKTVNFATIYGQGATALGQSLGIPRRQAKAYIERYFEKYSEVKAWVERTVAEAYEAGYVSTLLGRRRYIPEMTTSNYQTRAYGERIAANTPIQGSAADLCKIAMLQIDAELRARGMKTRMLLQIHDELIFEAPPEELDAACALVRDRMENCHPLSVPLKVDLGTGQSWAEAH